MDEDDPGVALLALATAYERTGMDRWAARRRVFAEHPHVAQAYHEGRTIPRPPRPRLGGNLRRLRPGEQTIDGRPYLHLCSDEASGGGIFAIGH